MAYINQETKKLIHNALKPVFKKYGLKATLGINNHSTLVINISQGKHDFIQNYIDTLKEKNRIDESTEQYLKDTKNLDVNHFWIDDHYTGDCKNCLNEIKNIANKIGKNYDNSDIMTDYFDVGFYLDINIGKWNKPYQTTIGA